MSSKGSHHFHLLHHRFSDVGVGSLDYFRCENISIFFVNAFLHNPVCTSGKKVAILQQNHVRGLKSEEYNTRKTNLQPQADTNLYPPGPSNSACSRFASVVRGWRYASVSSGRSHAQTTKAEKGSLKFGTKQFHARRVIFHWLSDTKRWGLVNRSGDLWRAVCLVASTITDLFSHPPTHRFKFSVSCYPILRLYMYKFFVEFAIKVRL